MTRRLKVYGTNIDGWYRGIVAAKSKTQAAKLLGTSLYEFNNYGCETGNEAEIELAMSEPGIAWKRRHCSKGEWERVTS